MDLDFNYIAHLSRERMIDERPKYEKAIIDLAERKDFQVHQSADSFAGRTIYCNYQSALGPTDRIEIDMNYLYRLPLGTPKQRGLWQPGEIDRPDIMVVSFSELIIGKLLAFFDRGAIRDIWDIGHLPETAPEILHSRVFRSQFVAMSATLDHPLYDYTLDRIEEQISINGIENDLLPMLTNTDAQAAVEIIDRAFDVVRPFLSLTDAELKYIDEVSQGRLRLDILFPGDEQLAARLAKHPALLWKIKNVQEMEDR